MSADLDFAQFDNSGIDRTAGVGEPTPGGGGGGSFGGEEFRIAVLKIIEDRLQEETERRAWRRGSEVF
ncbi:hypothetical protein ACPPVS_02450 [Cellulomonas sp. McL0617]|uniref:hypothetical protein n=1 Tax=Cellulomonas sp. McL0617 TaxID=3415675 RepID=UPI003CEB96A6